MKTFNLGILAGASHTISAVEFKNPDAGLALLKEGKACIGSGDEGGLKAWIGDDGQYRAERSVMQLTCATLVTSNFDQLADFMLAQWPLCHDDTERLEPLHASPQARSKYSLVLEAAAAIEDCYYDVERGPYYLYSLPRKIVEALFYMQCLPRTDLHRLSPQSPTIEIDIAIGCIAEQLKQETNYLKTQKLARAIDCLTDFQKEERDSAGVKV